MARLTREHGFTALRIEGGLMPAEFLQKVAAFGAEHQAAADYGLSRGLNLKDEIGRAWRIAKAEWQDTAGRMDRWWRALLQDVLCFRDFSARRPAVMGDRVFPVGFQAFGGAVPMVLAGPDVDLERPDAQFGDEHRKRSPHALMQEFLNAEDAALWGIVSNGARIRILRDNPSLTRPAFVEADLERIFAEDLYADFAAFWLLAHASRFEPRDARPERAVIETWRENAHKTGERALENLRKGVTEALRQLGTGFVARPGNAALRARLADGSLAPNKLFQELLRLVYRLLFLFTAEERGVLHPDSKQKEAIELYRNGYSLARLRDLALRRRNYDEHADLWQALRITFRGLAQGCAPLALPGLGGLFGADQCPTLDAAELGNAHLLRAIRALSFFANGNTLARVNYRDMGTEELGSVYESLLELHPLIETSVIPWKFGFVGDTGDETSRGSERKLSGSYYTPPCLVQELIDSALAPVLERTVHANPDRPAQAVLELKVIDPACGSGHFLLAAARRMAAEIARIESASDVPDEETRRHALREVVRHCIYGVDKNPLAVELCRTALWIETIEPGKPLSFLDAHIRCGDSVVGVFDPKIMEEGIPPEAYAALSGDEKTVCSALKAENKKVKIGHATQGDLFDQAGFQKQATEAGRFEAMPEDTVEQIAAKQKAWAETVSASRENRDRLRADLFVGAFLATKTAGTKAVVPTNADLNKVLAELPPRPGVADFARELTVKHQTFHWFLEFPHVFARTLSGSRTPGFDVVLGNPPWERIKIQEQEFFAARNPAIAAAPNQAARGRLIAALNRPDAPPSDRALWNEFQAARHDAEAASQYTRESGRFPLTGCGDVNTYALFSELFLNLPNQSGRAGLIVPSGIATDDSTKKFFGAISGTNRLARLADFENRSGLFPEVDSRMKFVLLTLGRNEPKGVFSFFAQQPSDLEDARRVFTLTAADIALINPNTRTCPVFRTTADAEITKKIYSRIPVLINEAAGAEGNPWGITFQAMFHMSNDSGLFKTFAQLAATQGLELRGNCFYEKARPADSPDTASLDRPNPAWLPLYEAKMIHQFDHRWATYETDGETVRNVTPEEKADPAFQPLPRYWVPAEEVYLKITRIPPVLKQAWKDSDDKVMRYMLAYWLAGYFQNHGESHKCNTIVQNILGGAVFGPFQAISDWFGSQKLDNEYPLAFEEHRSILATLAEGPKADIRSFVGNLIIRRAPTWLMGWRDICRATDERTIISAIFPRSASGDTLLLKFPFNGTPAECAALNGNLNSIACDYVARQKIGGTHLKYHVFKQIAVLPISAYTAVDLQFISSFTYELYYTSKNMRTFAEDVLLDCQNRDIQLNIWQHPNRSKSSTNEANQASHFDLDRRAILRAELDAYYAYLYGLNRKQLRYILDPADLTRREVETILDPFEEVADPLDRAGYEARVAASGYPGETFRVLKERELREFGEYRTRRLILEAWTRFTTDGTFARRGPPPDFSAEIAQAALRAAAPPTPEYEPSKKPSRVKKTVSRSKKAPSAAPAAPSDTTSPTMKDLFDTPTDDTSNE